MTGTTRCTDGTEMVTLDYSHLTSVLWGVCKGFQARLDRGIQTLKKDLATRVARKGGQWSDHFERAAGAYNARPHETVHGAPEDVEKQPATEFRVLQDNADKFQHNKDLTNRRIKAVEDAGAFRAPTNAARSFKAVGAVDSMTARRAGRPC